MRESNDSTALVEIDTHSASVLVAQQTTVAAASYARVGTGIGTEVAVLTTPNTAGLPIIRNRKLHGSSRLHLPSVAKSNNIIVRYFSYVSVNDTYPVG